MKNFAVFGINHKIGKSALREKVALNISSLPRALNIASRIFDEVVIVSTCNRMEIYVSDSKDSLKERILGYTKDFFKIDLEQFYFFKEKEALSHLMMVASSLDSMVVGEVEVLGQLKMAYKVALEEKTAKKTLSTMFSHSFRIAKRVRTETKIGEGNYSIPSIACSLAEKKLKGLKDKIVIVIGGGKISSITLKYLADKGTKAIFIGNRTFKKAEELAKRFCGIALHLKDCFKRFGICDLIVSQTSAPHYIIREKDIPQRRKIPLVLIDLAIPRDIEPTIKRKENVFLYDIDSLQTVCNKTIKKREKEIKKALLIIDEEISKIVDGR